MVLASKKSEAGSVTVCVTEVMLLASTDTEVSPTSITAPTPSAIADTLLFISLFLV
jgi:hypothetical protein